MLFTLLPTLSQVPDCPCTSLDRLVPVDCHAGLIRTLNSPHLFTGGQWVLIGAAVIDRRRVGDARERRRPAQLRFAAIDLP